VRGGNAFDLFFIIDEDAWPAHPQVRYRLAMT
jgi:hypothetical protein